MPRPGLTDARTGLRAALARNAKQRAAKSSASAASAAPAPAAPAKPKAKTWHPPKTEAEKAAFARVNERVQAVIEHPAFAQHQSVAIKLFANPRLSIAEIRNLLDLAAADTPAKQDSVLAEMKSILAEQRALNGNTSMPATAGPERAAKIWERAYAKLETEKGMAQ
jgi:hypothetical protein